MKPVPQSLKLQARRELLVQQAEAQRQQLSDALLPLMSAAKRVDFRIGAVKSVASNPIIIGTIAGAVLLIGPRRAFDFAKRGVQVWLLTRTWLPRIAALLTK